MPKIDIIYQLSVGLFVINWLEMGTHLSHLNQCDTGHYTVPIKLITSVRNITAGLQLLNLLKIILIQQDSGFLCNSAKFQNLLQTLVSGLIHCPCLLTFQTWAAALSHSEENQTVLLWILPLPILYSVTLIGQIA